MIVPEWFKNLMYYIGCFAVVGGAIAYIVKGAKFVTKPNTDQNKQIKENNEKIQDHEERLTTQEKQSELIMQGVLALLSHSIDGNNIDGMKTAKNDIQKFLIQK